MASHRFFFVLSAASFAFRSAFKYGLGAFGMTRGDVVRFGPSAFGRRLGSRLWLLRLPELGFSFRTLF